MRPPRATADLTRACERALARGARAAGAGTRQQVRAAARRFVRRHRRDEAALRRALRVALASASLAAALLGFGPRTALAEGAPFFRNAGAGPFFPVDVGVSAAPAAADLDADGDADFVVGAQDGTFTWLENTGSATSLALSELTGAANPLDGVDVGGYSSPAFGDLDGDGDADLVAGRIQATTGSLAYFENTGDAASPVFVERTGAANPFDGITTYLGARPALADVDRDGDLDLALGSTFAGVAFFENTGTHESATLVERTGAANPFDAVTATSASPTLGDADGDGDPDLVLGRTDGALEWWRNAGSAEDPVFEPLVDSANPTDGLSVSGQSAPALADIDGDGDLDVAAGDVDGGVGRFRNDLGALLELDFGSVPVTLPATAGVLGPSFGDLDDDGDLDLVGCDVDTTLTPQFTVDVFTNDGSPTAPDFATRISGSSLGIGFSGNLHCVPAVGDLDGDGLLDVVLADNEFGVLLAYENGGTAASPSFSLLTGLDDPFGGASVGTYPAAALGDVDGDGDLDAVVGRGVGGSYDLAFYEQVAGAFVERTGAANPFDGLVSRFQPVAPALGDVDADGDLDLAATLSDYPNRAPFVYFENTGDAENPGFVERAGDASPFFGFLLTDFPLIAFADLDGDRDLDLHDAYVTDFRTFENTIVTRTPRAREWTGSENPLDAFSTAYDARTAAGDLDGDGDPDVVSGQLDGTFRYFENTGSATDPTYTERTGGANPLDGFDTGSHSAPELGDLDGDGDLDLVAGGGAGTFRYYENTGSALAPAFVERTGAANPFDGFTSYIRSTPALADLDADGDLDLAAGGYGYRLFYFQNVGSASAPAFGEISIFSPANPFYGLYAGAYGAPLLADLDRDGDLDLVTGQPGGWFLAFENTGDATSSSFVALAGADNPFDGLDAGSEAVAVAADLDADGALEFVTGTNDGDLRVYSLPEPGGPWLWSAALLLLRRLARRRRALDTRVRTGAPPREARP